MGAKLAGMRERIRASDRLDSARKSTKEVGKKAGEVASEVADVTLKTCGFTAWLVGRALSPVVSRVRKAYSDYRDELDME